jgi:hypothetical protein
MSRIQFERRKRKKGYLIPLVIILLLYFTIPIFLVNKGSSLLTKANERMNENEVFGPTVEFYNGVAFLNTAAAFPGFGGWAKGIEESSTEKMVKLQESQFEKFCQNLLKNELTAENAFPDSTAVVISGGDKPVELFVKSYFADSSKTSTISLNDSILSEIDSLYCKQWNKFFEKTTADKSRLFSICK